MAMQHELSSARTSTLDPQFIAMLDFVRGSFVFGRANREHFHVVYLDRDQRYLDDTIIAYGSAACIPVRLRDVFARALKVGASGILVAHNHPSGDCRPSSNDIKATKRLRDIGQALEIELLDHLIFTRTKVYSMRAGGKL